MTFTYPLTAGVVGAPQMTSQPVSSIFLFPTALWDLAKCRPVHSLMLSSHSFFFVCLDFFTLLVCLARWFWPDLLNGRQTIPLQFASLYDGQEVLVGSDCLLDLGTDFLVPLYGLCMRCVVSCGSTSFSWLVFFFGALL